ncbi:hypothetical protein PVAP13_3KG164827 [Panicum virgatum]|uniref:Uncharacterized protein n=1 Tax=Panicum virgatum TaxID=38727 RepID=A0A8T0UWH3_PANVG|nr:hypothetical protein PVAP13_3KG164827 [Panicum virgatum]
MVHTYFIARLYAAAHECFICQNFSLDRDRDDSLTRKRRKRLVSASCALAKDSELASDLKIQAVNRACVLPPTRKSTSREHAVPKLVWDGHITGNTISKKKSITRH